MVTNKTKDMEVKVSELMWKKDMLNNTLKITKKEMEAMRKEKVRMMNEHIKEANNAKLSDQNLFEEILRYMNQIEEIQKLFGVVKIKGNQIKDLNGEKYELKKLVQRVNRELEEVLGRLRSKIQEVAGLKHKLEEAMEQIEEDKIKIEKMKEEMNSLEASLKSVKNENTKLQNGVKYFMSIFS